MRSYRLLAIGMLYLMFFSAITALDKPVVSSATDIIGQGYHPLETVESEIITVGTHDSGVPAVEFTPDGSILASVSDDKTIKLWNVSDLTLIDTLTGHSYGVLFIRFSANGSLAASCDQGGYVKLWNTADWSVLHSWQAHSGYCWSVDFNENASLVVTAGDDNLVKTWHVNNATLHKTLTGHSNRVTNAIFAPEGEVIASAGWDDTVILWNLADSSIIHTLTDHTNNVGSISFSDNGSFLVSGSWDQKIKMWNPVTGDLIKTFTGHTGSVSGLAFTPDCSKLVSCGTDESVRIWKTSSATLLQTFTSHTADVIDIDIEPIQDLIASGAQDNKVILYRGYLGTDSYPPETVITTGGAPAGGNWLLTDVYISLTATDNGSGVSETRYSLDNSTWNIYSGQFPLPADSFTELYYYSIDNQGNSERVNTAPLALKVTETAVNDTLVRLEMVNQTPFMLFERYATYGDDSSRNPVAVTWNGDSWQETQLSSNGWGYYFDIAVSPMGTPHVVFITGDPQLGDGDSFPYHAYWTGSGWSLPELIPGPWGTPTGNNHGNPEDPCLAFDSSGTLHLVMKVDDNMNSADFGSDIDGLTDIYYFTRSSTGTWTNHGMVSHANSQNFCSPEIGIDSTDKLHLVYFSDDSGNGNAYYRSIPSGGSWGVVTTLSTGERYIWRYNHLLIDAVDDLHLVYTDHDNADPYLPVINYQKCISGAWGTPVSAGSGWAYDFDIDSAGTLTILSHFEHHLASHVQNNGSSTWTTTQLTDIAGESYDWPQREEVGVSEAWSFIHQDDDELDQEIYYIPPDIEIITNIPPLVTVVYPNGGEVLSDLVTLQWTASDPDGDTGQLVFSGYYSTDQINWNLIPELDNRDDSSQSTPWDISSLPEGWYWLKIEASDGIDTSFDISEGSFQVIHDECVDYSYYDEWNIGWGQDIKLGPGGNIYMCNQGDAVEIFTPEGNHIGTWRLDIAGDNLNGPTGICFDSQWNLYVVSQGDDRIVKFDNQGNYVMHWTHAGINTIHRIACDSDDNLYVTDQDSSEVHKFDSSGNHLTSWSIARGASGGWYSVAVDSFDRVIVAAEYVMIYDTSGNFITEWGTPLTAGNNFEGPHGISIDDSDNIYILECDGSRVTEFDNAGKLITSWGSLGAGSGEFDRPLGLTVSTNGLVYVVDATNARIQVFVKCCELDSLQFSMFTDYESGWNGEYYEKLLIETYFTVTIPDTYLFELEIENSGNFWSCQRTDTFGGNSGSSVFEFTAIDLINGGFTSGQFNLNRITVYRQSSGIRVLEIYGVGQSNDYPAGTFSGSASTETTTSVTSETTSSGTGSSGETSTGSTTTSFEFSTNGFSILAVVLTLGVVIVVKKRNKRT